MERRKFIKVLGVSVLSLPVFFMRKQLSGLEAMAADGDLPFAEAGKATAPNFCVNADKSIKSKKTACAERKKKERATQYCNNCQLFQLQSGAGKDAVGKCMIMPQNRVHGSDWCMSWVAKPS